MRQSYLEYESQVVRVLLSVPGWLGAGHLDDGTAHTPDVTAAPVLLPPQHLPKETQQHGVTDVGVETSLKSLSALRSLN